MTIETIDSWCRLPGVGDSVVGRQCHEPRARQQRGVSSALQQRNSRRRAIRGPPCRMRVLTRCLDSTSKPGGLSICVTCEPLQ